jgi:hypothetical protein
MHQILAKDDLNLGGEGILGSVLLLNTYLETPKNFNRQQIGYCERYHVYIQQQGLCPYV